MRIAICLKQTIFIHSRMGIDTDGNIDPDAVHYILNPYDEVAVEEGLRIRESFHEVEISLISLGPERVEEVLRYGLAMGADRAFHVYGEGSEEGNPDPLPKAEILKTVLEKENYDLILFGKKSLDTNAGVLAGCAAELLGLPFVHGVSEIEVTAEKRKVRFGQMFPKGGRQIIECDLPAVLSVAVGAIKPRYPTLQGRLAASAKEIVKIDVKDLAQVAPLTGGPQIIVTKYSVNSPRPKKIFTPDSNLSAAERISQIMSGGMTDKKSHSQAGTSQDLAQQFIEFLKENKILPDRAG